MLYSVVLERLFEFLTGKSCTIISNGGLWKTEFGKQLRSSSMHHDAADRVDCVQTASIHLECASLRTRIVFLWNGPAKHRCSLAHGLDGHFQGSSGAGGGGDCTCHHSF